MWLDSEQWYRIRELDQALAKRTRKHFYRYLNVWRMWPSSRFELS